MEIIIGEDGTARLKGEPVFKLETEDWKNVEFVGLETKEDAKKSN